MKTKDTAAQKHGAAHTPGPWRLDEEMLLPDDWYIDCPITGSAPAVTGGITSEAPASAAPSKTPLLGECKGSWTRISGGNRRSNPAVFKDWRCDCGAKHPRECPHRSNTQPSEDK